MTTDNPGATPGRTRTEIQPRQLITTLLGLYARAEQNWLSVAAIITLMADLDVQSPAVRSSISRLKRRGTLVAQRQDGAAGYAPSASTLLVLAEGDVRIFDRKRAVQEDGWVLVVFSIPESERDKRHALRSSLTRLGFGTAAPGVWVAPGNLARETRETLQRRGLDGYVDLFAAEHLAFGDLHAKVAQWWDLDALDGFYAEFRRRYGPVHDRAAATRMGAREAFSAYVPMLTQWRRLPYLDPGLPLPLLPTGWAGVRAGELFDELNQLLRAPAHEHAMRAVHR